MTTTNMKDVARDNPQSSAGARTSNSMALLDGNAFRTRLMHFKCPIIKAVKCQITNADEKFNEEIQSIRSNNSWKKRLHKYRRYLLTLVLLVFLTWLLLLYGAFFGITLCGNSGSCARSSSSYGDNDLWKKNPHGIY